jgi:hypothetical protein
LEDAIVGAILDADADLSPAALAAGSVQLADFNQNRHDKRSPPDQRARDTQLSVLRFDHAAGAAGGGAKVKAVLVKFAAHPTIVGAARLRFSPDFVGPMRQVIEDELRAGAVFMQGASGDMSVNHAGGKNDHLDYGRALGREVVKVAAGLEPKPAPRSSLKVSEEQFRFAARVDFTSPAVALAYSAAFFPELVNNYLDEYADGVRPRLTVALLSTTRPGDAAVPSAVDRIALVGASGEFFSTHAVRLRQRLAGPRQVFFFGYCNGYHQYFPTIEAAAQGGYGADTRVAPAEVGAGERMMDAALIRLYQMMGRFPAEGIETPDDADEPAEAE